ncbi:MAG: hypothetical protein HY864_00115 [Chloroflexi bacterium]|nr:hypothetical protein [Chloroflexota bacterium]
MMAKLIRNLSLLALLVALNIMALIIIIPADTDSYLAAANEKHRLLHSVESPRIILVGGSNVALSIDSEKIENFFHIPVINMGLTAGAGLRFMLNEVEEGLQEGDIVIVLPEYQHLYAFSLDGTPKLLGYMIKACPECTSALSSPNQLWVVTTGILQTLEGDLIRAVKGVDIDSKIYFRQGFNRQGDLISHLDKPIPQKEKIHLKLPSEDNLKTSYMIPSMHLLNAFSQACVSANVRVYFMFPGILVEDYAAQDKKFSELYKILSAGLEFPILGTPQDFAYPEELFFDSYYHMNRAGREARTDKIIQLLIPVIPEY